MVILFFMIYMLKNLTPSIMIKGLENGNPEIRVGGAKILYLISRITPSFALKKVNEIQ